MVRVNSGITGLCRLKGCAGILYASRQRPFNSCSGRLRMVDPDALVSAVSMQQITVNQANQSYDIAYNPNL